MKNLNDFIDKYGLVTAGPQGSMDGGDSMCRTFSILYCDPKALDFEVAAKSIELPSKYFCRNPNPAMWYSNPECLSRDQIYAFIAFTARYNTLKSYRNALFIKHLMHGLLFAWNVRNNDALPGTSAYAWKLPDPTLFDILGLWLRSYRVWILYPLLVICDLQLLFNSVYRAIAHLLGKKWPNLLPDIDNINCIIPCHLSANCMPTPFGWLSWWLLKKTPIKHELDQFYGQRVDQPPVDVYVNKFLL